MPEINGRALTAIVIGSLFVWSGVKGWSVLGTLADIIKGGPPAGASVTPLTVGDAATTGIIEGGFSGGITGGGLGAAIAAEGVKWVGHPYRYAGAPGLDGKGFWDCSSFCNFIYAVKFGLPIPGYGPGKWDGSTHGPPTFSWNVWPGIKNVPRDQVQAGDVILFVFPHMGIAISNTMMVHAPNPKRGTVIDSIDKEGKTFRTARYM